MRTSSNEKVEKGCEWRGPTYSQFACIGSGISAIGLGATLKRWYGITDVRFFERHSDLGGTWFVNQYPGCACDVPSVLYSFSFEPNPKWTKPLPPHDELWRYLKGVAEKYDLVSKMTFGANVESCTWIEETQRWQMVIRDVETDELHTHECKFLFTGCGQLVEPTPPDMPGIETFKGPVFHASRWRHDVDLRDKRVAVFGNGCTGTQIVPAILPETRHLTHLFRSKHWIVPPNKMPNTAVMQWLFEHVPGVMAAVRLFAFASAEKNFRAVPMTGAAGAFRRRKQDMASKFVRQTAPERYHDMLIPDFEIGCKRRVFDAGYLACLHKENVTLTDARVEEVVPDGLRTSEGFIETDVIVMATGFTTNKFLPGIKVTGRDGQTLEEHWDKLGGPTAYNCTAVNGFPNFFMMLGPNSATGHTSTIMAVENSINFALRIIKPVLAGDALAAELTPAAEAQYVADIQRDLRNTVFASGCQSWYVDKKKGAEDGGDGGEQWNAMTYPYPQAYLWYRSLFPRWADWAYEPAPGAGKRRLLRRLTKVLLLTGFVVLLVSGVQSWRLKGWNLGGVMGALTGAWTEWRTSLKK